MTLGEGIVFLEERNSFLIEDLEYQKMLIQQDIPGIDYTEAYLEKLNKLKDEIDSNNKKISAMKEMAAKSTLSSPRAPEIEECKFSICPNCGRRLLEYSDEADLKDMYLPNQCSRCHQVLYWEEK